MQRFVIKKEFPSLNKLIFAKVGERIRLQRSFGQMTALLARQQCFLVTEPAFYTYLIQVPDRKMDPLNAAAGPIKLIEDGLVRGRLIPGDGRAWILGHAFYVQTTPGQAAVYVAARPDRCLTLAEALLLEEA